MTQMLASPLDVLAAYTAAVSASDQEAFLGLYAGDARVFDAWEVWEYQGKDIWRKTVASWFNWAGEDGGYDRPRFEEVQVSAGETHAFISAIVHYDHFDAEGKLSRSVRNRMSLGLVRQGEGWLIQQEHTSVPGSMDKYDEMLAEPPAA